MKKRRSNPIPLLSVIVLCFALIGYFNARSAPADKDAPAQQPAPPQNLDNSNALSPKTQPAPSKTDLLGSVHVGGTGTGPLMPAANKGGMPGGPPGGPGGPPGMPGGPRGMMHPPKAGNAKPYKPHPNDSSISTQWYTDETNKNVGN